MQLSIRRLGPGDVSILELLARDDADFDLDTRGDALAPLSPTAASAYLADPNVLHLIAVADGDDVIAGHMSGHVLRLRAGDASEFLLYEIGVRSAYRRKGVGRALIETMLGWVRKQGMRYSWVLADNPEAVEFYRACEYEAPPEMAVFMGRTTP